MNYLGVEKISFNRCQPLLKDLVQTTNGFGYVNTNTVFNAIAKGPSVLKVIVNDPNQRCTVHGQSVPIFGLPGYLTHLARPYNHQGRGICIEVDYNDPLFVKTAVNLIHNIGDQYDGHPNLAAVMAGILGAWGEGTTFAKGQSLLYSKTTQRAIFDAYKRAFKKTTVLCRVLTATPGDKSSISVGCEYVSGYNPFGVHVDNFMHPNDRHVLADVEKYGVKEIGVELMTELVKECLNERYGELVEKCQRYNVKFVQWGGYSPNAEEWERLKELDALIRADYRREL